MKSAVFLVVYFFGLSIFASTTPKPLELHALNSKIAKLLDFSRSDNYKKISKNLSFKDKKVFQVLLAKKKAQKVKLLPFMSFLYITDTTRQMAIEIVAVEPLKIKVDGGRVRTIDPKNIRGSFPKWKDAQISSWWSVLIPEAHAWCFLNCDSGPAESTPNDWELLYGYAASSEIYAGWSPIVTDQAAGIVANEVSAFVNEFGITAVNCRPPHLERFNTEGRRYIEVIGHGGERSGLDCDANVNSCRTFPMDAEGNSRNTRQEIASLDHRIVVETLPGVLAEVRRASSSINPNALDVRCEESSCHLVVAEIGQHANSVGPGLAGRIASVDISALGDRATRSRTGESLASLRDIQRVEALHTNPDGAFYPPEHRGQAMFAMMACCGAPECVNYVNTKGRVRINSSPAGVSQ